jgi:hypothetical protein
MIIGCDGFLLSLYGYHFRAHPHVNSKPAVKANGRLHKQGISAFNYIANIVGEATVGVRDIFSFFKQDDLRLLIHSAQSGSGTGSSSHGAYDKVFHKDRWFYVYHKATH